MNMIKRARAATAMTQQDVADKVGITRTNYVLIENGKAKPRVTTAYRIAETLGLDLDEMMQSLEKEGGIIE